MGSPYIKSWTLSSLWAFNTVNIPETTHESLVWTLGTKLLKKTVPITHKTLRRMQKVVCFSSCCRATTIERPFSTTSSRALFGYTYPPHGAKSFLWLTDVCVFTAVQSSGKTMQIRWHMERQLRQPPLDIKMVCSLRVFHVFCTTPKHNCSHLPS